jgi:hypothetical protein
MNYLYYHLLRLSVAMDRPPAKPTIFEKSFDRLKPMLNVTTMR